MSNHDKTPTRTLSPKQALLLGLIAGLLLMLGARFILLQDKSVHYHANFALYINGVRDEFKGPGYYEEIAACDASDHENLAAHVHMHDNKNHVAHVHHEGVTWGNFFANLGYALGDKVIATDKTVFSADENNTLSFILNGEKLSSVANRVIHSKDVLLVNYGSETDKALSERYQSVPTDAEQFNQTKDPAACSGSEHLNFTKRLEKTLKFWE